MAQRQSPPTGMSGRNAPRSRNGCSTCRTRKVKCDEGRPTCGRCRVAELGCEWLTPPPRRRPAKPSSSTVSAKTQTTRNFRLLLPRDLVGASSSQSLRNSLHLSGLDQDYLVYFPQSAVATWVGKPWKWTFLRYLYSNVAAESSVVMRMILAISATELERRRITDPGLAGGSTLKQRRAGESHYGVALREFRASLQGVRHQGLPPSREAFDEIVAAFYFMVSYELHYGRGRSGLTAHLAGVQAFLETCGAFADGQTTELGQDYSAMSKNLLYYIMYIGLNHGFLGDGQDKEAWLVTKDNGVFCELVDNLFQDSRDTNAIVFRGEYPPEALMDDISVYQPLEFIHECVKLRQRLLTHTGGCELDKNERGPARSVPGQIANLGRRFRNLILVAEAEEPPVCARELQTIYYSVADFHALEIICHRFICVSQAEHEAACHREAPSKLLAVLKRITAMDPRPLARISLPLAVALGMVRDPDEKRWIMETIETTRQVTGTSPYLTELDGSRMTVSS